MTRRGLRWRFVVGATAVAAIAVVAIVAIPDRDESPRARTAALPTQVTPKPAATWEDVPTELSAPDYSAALLWTGSEVITIFPDGDADVTGERYRPSDGRLRTIAPSGLEWRASPAIVWTGQEVIVAGGSNGPGIEHAAVAYAPATDTWRSLPAPPGFVPGGSENSVRAPAIWTGTEMISWHGGLAFDPSTNTWRQIADTPLASRRDEAVTAVDGRVFVWGGCDINVDQQCDEMPSGDELRDGALYDPTTDEWSPIPESPLGAGDHPTAIWTGTEVIVTVHVPADPKHPSSAAYDPATSTWRVLPSSPHPGGRYAVTVWTGQVAITHGGIDEHTERVTGATTALDPDTGEWFALPNGPERDRHTAIWAGDRLVIAGGSPSSSPAQLLFEGGNAALTPRPSRIAAVTMDGRLVVLDAETGDVLTQLATDAVANTKDAFGHWSLSATPDGSTIYYTRRVGECCVSIAAIPAGGGPATNPIGSGCCIRDPAVSPDGRWLAFTGVPNQSDAGRDILLIDLTAPAGTPYVRRWTSTSPLRSGVSQLAWGPNSTELAYVQGDTPDGKPPRVLDITLPESVTLDDLVEVPQSDAQRWAGYLGGHFLVISDAGNKSGESLNASGKPLRVGALNAETGVIDRVLFKLRGAEDAVADGSGAHVLAVTGGGTLYRWTQGKPRPTRLADEILAATWLAG